MPGYIDYDPKAGFPISLEEKDRLKKMSPAEHQAEDNAKKRDQILLGRTILTFLISIILFLLICAAIHY
jgi:hypothetical protein